MKSKPSGHQAAAYKKLQEEVKEVYKTVYLGNGKPALLTQLSELTVKMGANHEQIETKLLNVNDKIDSLEREIELKFKNITDVVTEKFNNIAVQITSEFGRKRSEQAHVWNYKTALTTAGFAFVTSVTVLLLAEFFKMIHG